MIRSKLKLTLKRLQEPSTWAGVASLGIGAGLINQTDAVHVSEGIPAIVAGISALMAIFMCEKKD